MIWIAIVNSTSNGKFPAEIGRSCGFSNTISLSGRPARNVPADLWFPASPTDQKLNCNFSQKCTKEFMGQQCIGEFVQYGFDRKRNQISCTDSPGSCERMVCECDLQFAKGIKKAVQSYDNRNHRFNGFKPDKSKL